MKEPAVDASGHMRARLVAERSWEIQGPELEQIVEGTRGESARSYYAVEKWETGRKTEVGEESCVPWHQKTEWTGVCMAISWVERELSELGWAATVGAAST